MKLLLAGLLFVCNIEVASAVSMPNPTLTPGAISTSDINVLRSPNYTASHRVWHTPHKTCAKYNIPINQCHLYEDDDLCPVCLGGNNADPLNHWAQPWKEAHKKDLLEDAICKWVKENGNNSDVENFQYMFRTNWPLLYEQFMKRKL